MWRMLLTSIPDLLLAVPSSYQNYSNLQMQVELINGFHLQRLSHLPEHSCECISLLIKSWSAVADSHINSSSDSSPSSLSVHAVAVWHWMKLLAEWESLPTATRAWIRVLLTRSELERSTHLVVDRNPTGAVAPWGCGVANSPSLATGPAQTFQEDSCGSPEIRGSPLISAPKKDWGSSAQIKRKKNWDLCIFTAEELLPVSPSIKKNPLKRTKEAPKRLSAAHQCWPAVAFTTGKKRRLEKGLESLAEILNKLVWIKAPRT